MKITKGQLRQIIKEELQTELFGFGGKKGIPYRGQNAKAIIQALMKYDNWHHANQPGLGEFLGDLLPVVIDGLQQGVVKGLPSGSEIDDKFRDYYGQVQAKDPAAAKVVDAIGVLMGNIADADQITDNDFGFIVKNANSLGNNSAKVKNR